ncbi:MAG: alpha/beta hydrolase [Burkholderiales bacterium]|nr:alpha/beta hydrolase [Burkholderiales bacterium]
MKLQVNGETLNCVVEGTGPAVALVHFLGGFSYQWRHQIAALKDRFTCIAYDHRGFGFSTFNGRWDVPTGARELKGVLDALGVKKAHVVGYSMGGPIALAFNSQWPEMVGSLALIDTFAKNHTHSAARIEESERCLRYMSMREYARQYVATRLLPDTPKSAIDEMVSAICLAKKEAYLDVLRGILLPDFTEHCAKVKAPTLVMCGRHDLTTPVTMTNELTRLIPGAVERIIPTGHLGALDDPAAFSRPLVEFLDAQPR